MRYVVLDTNMDVAIQSNRLRTGPIDFKITSEVPALLAELTEEVV